MIRKVSAGSPSPLGAHWDGNGVNFAVFSEVAERIEVCLFDAPDEPERERIALPEHTERVFHGHISGISPGQLYGFRVHGPWDPANGLRCNPHKVLLDPYARAVANEVRWVPEVYSYTVDHPGRDLVQDSRDNAPFVPKGVVLGIDDFPWDDDKAPNVSWENTVIYEAHLKGMTQRHPEVPPSLRGTYLGMAHPSVLSHLRELGVTAIEFLPVHEMADEHAVIKRGMKNYWGYCPLAFFAPAGRYSSGGRRGQQVREFKSLVKACHSFGIEVWVDVVYNHTMEGNELGPSLSLRGIDNATYYRLARDDPRFYADYTGTGNTLNTRHPQTLQLILDSLRYWATELRVDGFRFDLASALAREEHWYDKLGGFLDAVHQDPVLSRVKLVAEPWDVGEGGYHVGNFPRRWSEWNGKYRDAVRKFWLGDRHARAELGYRLTGSADLYALAGRGPRSSINFVTAHDGFTLNDLVSYDRKHNAANGEENRDGADHNDSWNHGVEGATNDPNIRALRARQQRNLLATLLLSMGVPMLSHGDEFGRTQHGNNNVYCQDNELSWMSWDFSNEQRWQSTFVSKLTAFRARSSLLRRNKFLVPRNRELPTEQRESAWLRDNGQEMTHMDWIPEAQGAFGLFLSTGIPGDEALLLLLNNMPTTQNFALPGKEWGEKWERVIDTGHTQEEPPWQGGPHSVYSMVGRSLVLLERKRG